MGLTTEEFPPATVDTRRWLDSVRLRCQAYADVFVADQCERLFAGRGEGAVAVRAIPEFVRGGKFLRPMMAYVGWRCGAPEDDHAARAASSLELLHCFALAQDDVMDASALRRGRPALHTRFSRWHDEQQWSGSPDRFGASAAILTGDLFLVWAERMLRESGLGQDALARGWPLYDDMRAELAAGQLADLVNDSRRRPSWDAVLDVLRRKSGNYTVRRPLEFGAALAGCDSTVMAALGEYGGSVGEAFQFRDDLLGTFGDPAVTGKPAGQDLRDRKASSVVVLALDLAVDQERQEIDALLAGEIDDVTVDRLRDVITATGAPEQLEKLIDARVTRSLEAVDLVDLPRPAFDALTLLAARCTDRRR
ncbi:polyprenyl synthetase family protein [Amycolatopsis sp. cmx-11-12]|uniref:polyprenyl synthetase family protein n=1 Tax=Amycolatopsis sp. cmx-11-12 TaxID=2785795 RepID=UPI003917F59A